MKLFRSAASAILATGLLAGSAVMPASAHSRDSVDYVALGDSYAAGVGAPPYLDENCGVSPDGYPELLDNRRRIDLEANRSCSGATTIDVFAELASLNEDTDLVTLTVGGNDVEYQNVIGACGFGPDACRQVVDSTLALAQTDLAAGLLALYLNIGYAAPGADVVVTGYPHLFSPEFGATFTFPAIDPDTGNPVLDPNEQPVILTLTPVEQQILNEGTDILNDIIRIQVEAAAFTYVDVVDRFEGHGLGSPRPWIQPFGDPAALHPTAKGYKHGYFPEIRRAVKNLD